MYHFRLRKSVSFEISYYIKNVIAPILIVLLIAAVLGGFLIYQKQAKPVSQPTPAIQPISSPTPDETANWKTYTNSEFNFVLKYPSDWKRREDKLGYNLYNFSFSAPVTKPREGQMISVSIFSELAVGTDVNKRTYIPKPNFKKLYDKPKEATPSGPGEAKLENLTLDGLPAVKTISHTPIEPAVSVHIYINKDPYLYDLSAWQNGGYKISPELLETFSQMLSTFKFLP